MISHCRRRRVGPAGFLELSRHRDPAPVGVRHTVPVESYLLHCSGIDELSKEGTFCFRPALVNNDGSMRMIHSFRAYVKFFGTAAATLSHYCVACGPLVRPLGVNMALVRF